MNTKHKLKNLNLTPDNCIVIGSGVLEALNIRGANDIDTVVTKEKYKELTNSGILRKETINGRELLTGDDFEIGNCWNILGKDWSFEDLIHNSIIIDNIRYNSVDFLLKVKKDWIANKKERPKDIEDVRLMEEYLNKLTQKEIELQKNGDGLTCPIAIIEKDGKILAGHRHYTTDKWKKISVWTIPGGRSDVGENIEQTLRREVAEEVDITDLEILDFIGQAPGAKEGDIVLMFYCTTNQDGKLMEPEKFSEWKWISIEEYISNEKYSGFNPAARKMIIEYLATLPTE
jgi:ADP-ribose pyrophosphatase YjhB (NUDIX family)